MKKVDCSICDGKCGVDFCLKYNELPKRAKNTKQKEDEYEHE